MSALKRTGDHLLALLDSGIFHLADRRRILDILERVALILLAGTTGVALTAYYLDWPIILFAASVALMGIFLSLACARGGHARIASMILLVTLYGMITLAIYLGDGIRDVGVLLLPLVLILGSFLLSRVAYVALSSLCIGTVVGVGVLQLSGMRVYTITPTSLPGDIVLVLVLMATVAVLVRTLAGVISDSLRRIGQSERNYREMFDASSDSIIIHAPSSTRILHVNAAAAAMLGYTREELLTKSVPDISWDPEHFTEERVTALMQDVLRGGAQTVEWSGRRKDGSQMWIEIRLHAVTIDSQDRIVALGRDIDRRRRVEEQMRQGEKMQAVGLLAGGIAHDFNNQLAGIIGYADLMHAGLDESQKDLRESVQGILLAAGRSAKLTAQLLAFARKARHDSKPVDLHALIGDVIGLLTRSIDKRITIARKLNASPAVTLGDPALLQSALLNLAINARDAMPTGGALTFASDTVSVDDAAGAGGATEAPPPGQYVRLRVQDTGGGMSSEIENRIFEPFFTTKPEGQGTGMGLSAVYGTVQNHGGSIDVESQLGQGTTFTVLLPLHDGPLMEDGAPAPVEPSSPQMTQRVLIVDDEAVVCSMAARLVEQFGGTAKVCRDGAEAVAYYEHAWASVDVIVLDMVMPRMGGSETFHRLREINPLARVLLISGYSVNDEVQTLLKDGAGGFLQKPFRKEEFRVKLGALAPATDTMQTA